MNGPRGAALVLIVGMLLTPSAALPTMAPCGWRVPLGEMGGTAGPGMKRAGVALLASLILLHTLLH
ncbi:MAG: hypothetical protein QF904_11095 [Gemmatimonadota bacterium]|nr:hypothetical protein [Gemmatimonadota bacterium]